MNNMHNSKFDSYLDINSEVQNAIDNREPIVALESTIICHGMPFPKNLETAIEVESVVREDKTNYGLMTYMHEGKQYIILQTGPKLTALALYDEDAEDEDY